MYNNQIDNYFSIDEYLKLLETKKTICTKDYKKHKNGVIVRHDVDFSLDMAYEFSRYEKENNINSTYYLLLTTDLYNIFTKDSKKKIEQMLKDGFEIGIHFDPTVYGNLDEQKLIQRISVEIDMFEQFFDYDISSYSMHNPSVSGIYINYPNLINAYDPNIFSDSNYISDSSYSFRGKNPNDFLSKSNDMLIQFLTHPIHFFGNLENTYEKQLNNILNEYYVKVDSVWNMNKVYLNTKKGYSINILKKGFYKNEV